MSAIKSYFYRNHFDKELPFIYRLSSIFFIEAFILSMLSFTMNVVLGASNAGIVIQGVVNLLFVAVFFIPVGAKQKILPWFLLGVIYLYLPFMFFQYGGYEGSVLYFTAVGMFLLSFMFSGAKRVVAVAANIAIYVVAILLQANYPWVVTAMANPEARVPDLLAALVFTLIGIAVLARYVTNAYENERVRNMYLLNEVNTQKNELQELSIKDGLTGIFNRRYFTEALEQALIRSKAEDQSVCLIMFDIDFFKKINDTFGHSIGDEVLVSVVEAAQTILRKQDVLARYGGEEFMIILYPETIDNAVKIAERIRMAVSVIELADGSSVTVSLGVAESHAQENSDELMQRVDERLYAAKNSGRNRVEY